MGTQFVGLKEFKQNISQYADKINKKNQRFVVLRKNKPLFEVTPLRDNQIYTEKFLKDIKAALADVKAGRVYTAKEVRKHLGI